MEDYTLTEITVDAKDLLLDPRNPRIIEDPTKYICSRNADYAETWIQDETLAAIQQGKFNVNKLKKSIKTSGFLNIDSIFVKRYSSSSFLVLEGNRRTAAIKSLLSEPDLAPEIRNSILRIPVKVLDIQNGANEEEIITSLLSIRHLDGPLEWEPMQRAFVVFQTYNEVLKNDFGQKNFSYIPDATKKVNVLTNIEKVDIWRNLSVVRIFLQLKEMDLGVTSSHYSIIDKTISYQKLNIGYFGYDRKTLQFSDIGAEKFASLCLNETRLVNDPKKVRNLNNYFKSGRTDLIDKLESRTITLEEADQLLKDTAKTTNFISTLKAIDKEINKLRPTQFQGTAEEKLLLQAIHQKIEEKLMCICR